MKIPVSRTEVLSRVKGSKFQGILLPVSSERALREQLGIIAKEYRDATHISYAYRFYDSRKRSVAEGKSDAGEPPGTAGGPILLVLRRHEIVNGALIVIRYFGGVKLGRGGLARAYGDCASLVMEHASLSDFVPLVSMFLKVPYGSVGVVERAVRKFGGRIVAREFGDASHLEVEVPEEKADRFRDWIISASSGEIEVRSRQE